MKIIEKKLYENRTWKYLYPCLKHYNDLVKKLNKFFILGVGINDTNFEKNNCIYILVDTNFENTQNNVNFYQQSFSIFLSEIVYEDYYVADYIFNEYSHMLIIKIPRLHFHTYKKFIVGEYSKMYSKDQINKYFSFPAIAFKNKVLEIRRNKEISHTISVLNKDPHLIKDFVDKTNKNFNTNVNPKNFLHAELDYPPIKKQEIFNYD